MLVWKNYYRFPALILFMKMLRSSTNVNVFLLKVAKLGQQYAKLLGHQNKKQKIRHVIKLKDENGALKAVSNHNYILPLARMFVSLVAHSSPERRFNLLFVLLQEVTKLRDQAEKQKRNMRKLQEKLDHLCGNKRFNPTEAFSHSRKENVPLSVISNGRLALYIQTLLVLPKWVSPHYNYNYRVNNKLIKNISTIIL